jgi:hypothetical protein
LFPRNLLSPDHLVAEADDDVAQFLNRVLELLDSAPLCLLVGLSTLAKDLLGSAVSLSACLEGVSARS